MRKKGYTLIELVMSISLLVIVLLGGTAIFFRSLRSSGISDIQSSVNNNLRTLDEMIEGVLRYGTVTHLVGLNDLDIERDDCLLAGDNGVTGKAIVIRDSWGATAQYTRGVDIENERGYVASNSAMISNPEIDVTKLEFLWYCRSGVNDKIKLLIEAKTEESSGETISGKIDKDINMLNSGIN